MQMCHERSGSQSLQQISI
uniref:Uncharacterized protein n=1 Tax=Arundo donax TaxID=35708 RepID=A0A0A9FHX0_ARUDO